MDDMYSRLAVDAVLAKDLCAECDIPSVEYMRAVDSTQRRARELAARDAPEWSLVVANYQTAGRGQHGRRWAAAPGSAVMFSILVVPRTHEALSLIPLRVGQIVLGTLNELAAPTHDARIKLKWPNDLIARDAKLGGILCEAQTRGDDLRAVVGVGINVRPFEQTPGVSANAISLDDIAQHSIERFDVLRAIVKCLRSTLDLSSTVLAPDELARYSASDWLRGREISEPVHGTVTGINPNGHLLVRSAHGDEAAAVSGSIRLVAAG